eukprot:366029-Chlamydomonas_euryale.AAC.23
MRHAHEQLLGQQVLPRRQRTYRLTVHACEHALGDIRAAVTDEHSKVVIADSAVGVSVRGLEERTQMRGVSLQPHAVLLHEQAHQHVGAHKALLRLIAGRPCTRREEAGRGVWVAEVAEASAHSLGDGGRRQQHRRVVGRRVGREEHAEVGGVGELLQRKEVERHVRGRVVTLPAARVREPCEERKPAQARQPAPVVLHRRNQVQQVRLGEAAQPKMPRDAGCSAGPRRRPRRSSRCTLVPRQRSPSAHRAHARGPAAVGPQTRPSVEAGGASAPARAPLPLPAGFPACCRRHSMRRPQNQRRPSVQMCRRLVAEAAHPRAAAASVAR